MMPSDVFRRNRVPAIMLDCYPSFVADRFEPYFHPGDLRGRKRLLTPGEGEPYSRLPRDYSADFKDLAVRQFLN